MSEVQNDKKIIDDASNPFEGSEIDVTAPLRDRIPRQLLAKLKDKNVGSVVESIWRRGNSDRTEWLKRQEDFLKDWDNFLDAEADEASDLTSNLHLPMTFIVAKTYHARMLQALEAVDPAARERRPDGTDRAQAVTELMLYTVDEWVNNYKGMSEVNDLWVWDWITSGVGVIKWRWEARYTKFVDVEQRAVPGRAEIVEQPGGEQISVPTFRQIEVEVERVKEIFKGPVCDRVAPEDFLIVGGKGDPQAADSVIHREWLTKSDLMNLAYQEIFDEDEARAVIEAGPDHKHQDQTSAISQTRELRAGTNTGESEADLDRYELLECWMKYDVDGSGIDSDIVVWVHPTSKRILRATYAHRLNQTGRRPFIKVDFFKRPGQDYGFGIVEALYSLQKELDMFHNTRVDFGMLSTAPFGFYKPASTFNPETIRLEPGQLIPLENPQTDVFFPNLGNRTAFGFQEEAGIMGMIERMTGVNELTLGALTGVQGPTRTATGAQALMTESNANLDVHLKRLFSGLRQSYEYLLNMLQLRVDSGFAYRVTGEDGSKYWDYIKQRDDISGDFDFVIDPSSASSNPQIRQQRAMNVVQVTSNPLNLQMGIVTPANHYEALKEFFKTNGVKGFSKYLTKPSNFATQMTPEEMANRILRGEQLIPQPTDDNKGFIAYIDNIMSTDELLGQFSEEQVQALTVQRQEREALLEAMRRQEAQAANLQQIIQNASAGVNPNPQVGAAPLQ